MIVFISYSHKDTEYHKQFDAHLSQVKRNGEAEIWSDSKLVSGDEVDPEIMDALSKADIFVCLVSSDYLNSSYCMDKELGGVLDSVENKNVRLIPVVVRDCDWSASVLSKYLHATRDAQAISSFSNIDSAWKEVVTNLRNALDASSNNNSLKNPQLNSQTPFNDQFDDFLNSTDIALSHRHKDQLFISDIFVYQQLKENKPDFNKIDDIGSSEWMLSLEKIKDRRVSLILGSEQSGKTSLAKMLVKKYRNENASVLWLDASEVTRVDIERVIRKAVRNQYGSDIDPAKTDYESLIVLIDNYQENKLNARARRNVINELVNLGTSIVVFCDTSIRFDEEQYTELADLNEYEILPFGHVLRDEIIGKWIDIGTVDTLSEQERIHQKNLILQHVNSVVGKILPPKPIYIISIIQLLDSSSGSDQSLTSYGYCYYSLIVSALSKVNISANDQDSYFNFLTEYSYFLHTNNVNDASEIDLKGFREMYDAKYYGLTSDSIINKLVQAKLLHSRVHGLTFRYKFINYFFVAKYLSEKLNEPDVHDCIDDIFENLHTDRNAYIIIFLTHHSKDDSILSRLIKDADSLFDDRSPISLTKQSTEHIFDHVEMITEKVKLRRSAEEERLETFKSKDDQEHENHSDQSYEPSVTTSTESREGKEFLVEINRSIRLIEITGQIMRNRYGSLTRDNLNELANTTFNAGFKFLDFYLEALHQDEEHIIDVIEKLLAEHKRINESKLDSNAKKIFLMLCYRACFSVISKIGSSMGHEKLIPFYKDIYSSPESTEAQRLVCVAVLLDQSKVFPKEEIEKLNLDSNDNPVVYRLLRELVIRHAYLNNIATGDRQWISSKLNLNMDYQRKIQRKRKLIK